MLKMKLVMSCGVTEDVVLVKWKGEAMKIFEGHTLVMATGQQSWHVGQGANRTYLYCNSSWEFGRECLFRRPCRGMYSGAQPLTRWSFKAE